MTGQNRGSRNLIIGLSGPSSSGKTSLARLLRSVFTIPASPETNHNSITLFILHEDDFYKTDAEIPTVTTPATHRELQDWDCASALDLPLLERTLDHIHDHGSLPPQVQSKEDQNSSADSGVVPDSEIDRHRREIVNSSLGIHRQDDHGHHQKCAATVTATATATATAPSRGIDLRICILEGFLLYPDPNSDSDPEPHQQQQQQQQQEHTGISSSITALLDLKLFLRSTYALTRRRRQARPGYVTQEGFWEDPPGYVDEVVWPNYVREHGWMFEGGDVDRGELRMELVGGDDEGGGGKGREGRREGRERGRGRGRGMGIHVGPGKGEKGMRELLEWAVGVVGARVGREIGDADAEREERGGSRGGDDGGGDSGRRE